MDKMRVYDETVDFAVNEIDKIIRKDEIDEKCLMYLDKLVDIAKDMETTIAMVDYGEMPDEETGYSGRSYPYYRNYDNGSRNYGRSMRYNNNGGSRMNYRGRSGDGDVVAELESLMQKAKTERERDAIRQALEQM